MAGRRKAKKPEEEPSLASHLTLTPEAWQALKYFLVLAGLILLVVVLIIVFKGLRAQVPLPGG
jgi:hypothetical protein